MRESASAKINISYSILFNLTTSYSSYFGGKKGISRNKTSFFLLMQRYLHLAKLQLEQEEEGIKQCLTAAQVSLCIAPHLDYDREQGEVPADLFYPQVTNRPVRYLTNCPLRGGTPWRSRGQ